MKKPVVLRIYKGDQLLGVKQFLDAQIVIGQPGDVQVALEGESVSFIHASIEERGGAYFVSDLGSASGTFRNGQQVLDSALESGDTIQIGDYKVEFFIGPPKPKATATTTTVVAPTPAPPMPAAAPKAPPPPSAPVEVKSEQPKPVVPPSAPKVEKPAVADAKVEEAPADKTVTEFDFSDLAEKTAPAIDLKLNAEKGPEINFALELTAPEVAKPKAETEQPKVAPEKPVAPPAPTVESKAEVKPEAKPEIKPEAKPEAKVEAKPEPKVEVKPEAKPEIKVEAKPEVKVEPKPEAKSELKVEAKPTSTPKSEVGMPPAPSMPPLPPQAATPVTPPQEVKPVAPVAPIAPVAEAKAPEKKEEVKLEIEKPADKPELKLATPIPPPVKPPTPSQTPATPPATQASTPIPPAPKGPSFGIGKSAPKDNTTGITPPSPVPPNATAANRVETGSAAASGMGGGVATGMTTPVSSISRPRPHGPRANPAHPARENGHKKKKKKTFAPPSRYNDVKEYIKPSKGTVVEVLVAWRERVIATHHFSQKATITIGSHPKNDIVLPVLASNMRKIPIVKIDGQAIVLITPEMSGELIKGQTSSNFVELLRQNRMIKVGATYNLNLDQGEMVRIELGDQLSVLIRYVSDSPKPLVAPFLDLTATETTGVVLSIALVATLWLYMYLYSPPKLLAEEANNDPEITATIVMTPPTPPPLPPPPPPEPEPLPTPPPVVATPPPQKVVVKVDEKTREAKVEKPKAPTVTNLTTKNDPGKSAAAAPNKNKTGPRIQTSVKQGGAIKTSQTEGAQMQSKNRDMSKAGIFSAFGSGGQQDELAQSTTGAGELAGLAGAATGKAGSSVDRAGKGLGSELKDTGQGGNGKSLEGIVGGVGTTGRGSGNTGYGTGGLGNRQGTKIVTGGTGEIIPGTIDREAIRRVILANIKTIRACYERELNRKPDLFGKLVLSWDIGEQGRVVATRVKENQLGSPEVAGCIMEKLKLWKFPDPPANQVVVIEAYPFLFSN